jgi:hypothetical protein
MVNERHKGFAKLLRLEPNDSLASERYSSLRSEMGSWQKVRRGEKGKKKTEAIASVLFLCSHNNFEP